MKDNKNKTLREPEYKFIKTLTDAGVGGEALKLATKRSPNVLLLVRKSKDYADYGSRQKELYLKYRSVKAPVVPVKVEKPTTEVYLAPNAVDLLIDTLAEVKSALIDLARAYDANSEKLDEVLDTKRPWVNKLRGF